MKFIQNLVAVVVLTVLQMCENSYAKDESLPNPLEVKIEASRSRPSAGTSISVLVRVRNISSTVLFLDKKNSILVFPTELSVDEHAIGRTFVYFGDDEKENLYRLNPGDDIRMSVSTPDSPESQGSDEKSSQRAAQAIIAPALLFARSIGRFLSFSPGDFKVTAMLIYTTEANNPNRTHIKSEDLTVNVSAPQSVILLGAALGGILAYLLLPQTGGPRPWYRHLYATASSALLGITVTILLSRISETQFFIRITITDFWGAIAMGFIAGYGGRAVLDRISSAGGYTATHHAATKTPPASLKPATNADSPPPASIADRGEA